MKDKTRNLLVGLTVLVALGLLGGMILLFQELPTFLRVGYEVRVKFADTGGVDAGSDVVLRGKRIGRVARVDFTDNDPREGVTMVLIIERDRRIPGKANAYVHTGGFTGGAAVVFVSDGMAPGSKRQWDWIPRTGDVVLQGLPTGGGGGLIPQDVLDEVRAGMKSISRLADTLNAFLTPPEQVAPSQPSPGPGQPPTTTRGSPAPSPKQPPNFFAMMARLDDALRAVSEVLGDKENQQNIRAALVNFKTAAAATAATMEQVKVTAQQAQESIRKIGETSELAGKRFDELTAKLIEDADRLGTALTRLDSSLAKIDSGDGTLGKLLNDPKLYNNLVDAAAEMKTALTRLQEALEAWKDRGIRLRLW